MRKIQLPTRCRQRIIYGENYSLLFQALGDKVFLFQTAKETASKDPIKKKRKKKVLRAFALLCSEERMNHKARCGYGHILYHHLSPTKYKSKRFPSVWCPLALASPSRFINQPPSLSLFPLLTQQQMSRPLSPIYHNRDNK